QHLPSVRRGRSRRDQLSSHGISGGRDAGRSSAEGTATAGAGIKSGSRDLRRIGESASQRGGASGPEAQQHHAHQERRQVDGLWAGQSASSRSWRGFIFGFIGNAV